MIRIEGRRRRLLGVSGHPSCFPAGAGTRGDGARSLAGHRGRRRRIAWRDLPAARPGPQLRRRGSARRGRTVAVNSAGLDRFLSFDPGHGRPRGRGGGRPWSASSGSSSPRVLPARDPGHRPVTLGGALASNVHGKNHHRADPSSISSWNWRWSLRTGPSPARRTRPDLFRATVGGYGLTGFITRARLRLKPIRSARVDCLRVRARGLDALFRLFERHDAEYEYSVAWLDTLARGRALGRGVLMLGNHEDPGPPPMARPRSGRPPRTARPGSRCPFPMPGFLLNRASFPSSISPSSVSAAAAARPRRAWRPSSTPSTASATGTCSTDRGASTNTNASSPIPPRTASPPAWTSSPGTAWGPSSPCSSAAATTRPCSPSAGGDTPSPSTSPSGARRPCGCCAPRRDRSSASRPGLPHQGRAPPGRPSGPCTRNGGTPWTR